VVSTLGIVLDGLTRIQQLVDEQRAALRQIDQDGSGVAGSK
jgi:hypothetical protein